VTVKIDMPATEAGIDVYPESRSPIDFGQYSRRLKDAGIAIHSGDAVLVTKVKLKDQHIEFQLGGGGYGTFGDNTDTHVHVPEAEKTTREKNLERDLKNETDAAKRRAMREELDDLKKERDRENARNRAAVAEAEERKRENIRRQALSAGSRFNIRYGRPVPLGAVTPEAVIDALAEYVQFGAPGVDTDASPPATDGRPASLRKGLTRAEAEELLGRPQQIREGMEGTLRTVIATYLSTLGRVEALFVEGVLVRYTVSSE
jgi:hypothetical protein